MKLSIMLEMGPPKEVAMPHKQDEKAPSVEQQVREAIECIESGHDSYTEWKLLNKLYGELRRKEKKSPRIKNLIEMIEPVLAKYGLHGVEEESA